MNKYLKIEYWNTCDLGKIYYQGGQQFYFYLDGDVLEPAHEDTEDGHENGDGEFIPTYRKQVKRYTIRTALVSDYLIDAIHRMKLHDNIYLTFKTGERERIYNVEVSVDWVFERFLHQGMVTLTFDIGEGVTLSACCSREMEILPPGYDRSFITVGVDGSDEEGDGTLEYPYRTIAHGISVAGSGDTVFILAGTYNISTQINVPVGVNIKGMGNTSVIVGITNFDFLFALRSVEGTVGNNEISHLRIDGDLMLRRAIESRGRGNIKVHHCEFVDMVSAAICLNGKDNAPAGAPSTYATGLEVYDNTLINCSQETYNAGSDAWFATASIEMSGTKDMIIRNNVIDNVTGGRNGYGIKGISWYEGHNMGLLVEDNTFHSPYRHTELRQWSMAIELWNNYGGITIRNNIIPGQIDLAGLKTNDEGGYGFAARIHDNIGDWESPTPLGHWWISLESEIKGGVYIYKNECNYIETPIALYQNIGVLEAENIFIYLNIFKNLHRDINYKGRMMSWSVAPGVQYKNIQIYNNIQWSDPAYRVSAGVHCDKGNAAFEGLLIANNIFYNAYNPIRFENGCELVDLEVRNNLYFENNTQVTFYNMSEPDSWVNLNNITSDPLFIGGSPFSFKLQSGSPCIDAGINVGLTEDYEGKPITGTPDIGAYEY